jgi:hypothetical protein
MTQSKKGKKEILVKSPGAFIASVSCQTVNVIPHLFNDQIMVLIIFFCQKTIIPFTGCLKKKNGPGYNFTIDDPNEKSYTRNEMALKTI